MLISWQVSILTGNIRVGAKRFAYYNNLKPGTYTFQLKASNANGIWDDEMLRMEVVILPPPGKHGGPTPYILYVFVLLSIILSG